MLTGILTSFRKEEPGSASTAVNLGWSGNRIAAASWMRWQDRAKKRPRNPSGSDYSALFNTLSNPCDRSGGLFLFRAIDLIDRT